MTPLQLAIRDRLDNLPWVQPAIRAPQGIVVVAGGELYFRLAWHLLHGLRELGCCLPVEVWHLGPHEMTQEMAGILARRGATVIDASRHAQDHKTKVPAGGWQLKAYAMRYCGFAEAMLLDADNVPVVDPHYLFCDRRYERAGAGFWPDLPPSRDRQHWIPPEAWQKVGLEHQRHVRPFESGQMLVNRTRHLAALDVALLLNEWSDEVYQVVYGDKDTFLLAWHLTRSSYSMPSRNPAWRAPAICQHDWEGNLVFQHACQGKKAIVSGTVVPSLINRRWAPDAAAELQRLWTGRIEAVRVG